MPQPRFVPEVDEELDPRPVAAYLLGGHTRMAADRLEACQRWPQDHLGYVSIVAE
ncbi:MAG TPA: hypothetical protein VMG10_07425 [Gemmataceae bacterium]|nr:hypothetical protein [Gemmataceae bacterium]